MRAAQIMRVRHDYAEPISKRERRFWTALAYTLAGLLVTLFWGVVLAQAVTAGALWGG